MKKDTEKTELRRIKAHRRNVLLLAIAVLVYIWIRATVSQTGAASPQPRHVTAAEVLGTMTRHSLQGSQPDLQPADRVQPQAATGGVGSY